MARSGNAECGCGVRIVEALRCRTIAVPSREHSNQPSGQRRRGMLRACGACPYSERLLLLLCLPASCLPATIYRTLPRCLRVRPVCNRSGLVSMMGSLASLRDEFRVEEITGTDVVPLTYDFRYRVRSKEARLIDSRHQMGIICDEHESHSRHWAAVSWEGILGASARLCIHDSQQRCSHE